MAHVFFLRKHASASTSCTPTQRLLLNNMINNVIIECYYFGLYRHATLMHSTLCAPQAQVGSGQPPYRRAKQQPVVQPGRSCCGWHHNNIHARPLLRPAPYTAEGSRERLPTSAGAHGTGADALGL